jgi:hypothetical protein
LLLRAAWKKRLLPFCTSVGTLHYSALKISTPKSDERAKGLGILNRATPSAAEYFKSVALTKNAVFF